MTPSAVSFSDLSIAACNEAPIPKNRTVILTSDGVHDQMEPTVLNALVHAHQSDAQVIAEALVAAAEDGIEDGQPYRDDATTIAIRPPPAPPDNA
ncbi:PP2C family serine/threonine-protein phosphatase [Streptomyces sp. NPDC001553]|uniref:PP2C family serine/threonine-protein phosphatase n=1 Tax=Streptomyces sp. NPDC001553 TaxID=3154385 RepID=UPI00331A461D